MTKIVIDGGRTRTIRTVVLAAFAGVAFVVLATLGLHQLRRHGFSLDLPGHMGVNISETSNGFTYSQSQRGHTLFTLHASRIVEFKNNQAELHGVSITLYGPPGSHRQDHISGSDFRYDRASGLVTASGPVEIDMASPAESGSSAAPPDDIHVKTSGLRFNQNTGVARTAEPLAFTLPRASGKAVGGSYNSKTGILILQSQVELVTQEESKPVVIDAGNAELVRDAHLAYLLKASSQYEGGAESADEATVHFRPDGTLQHLDAQGHVHLRTQEGAEFFSSNASVAFDAHGQPVSSYEGGGVNFLSDSPDSNMHGNAVEGTLAFVNGPDGRAVVSHAHFDNAVSFVFFQRSLDGDPRGSATRELTASVLDINLGTGPGGKAIAQQAVARGGAMVNLHDLPYGAPPRHTSIYGAQLTTMLADGHELRTLDGTGGTRVVYHAPDGSNDTTTGDALHVTFTPTSSAGGAKAKNATADVATAMQQGHVTLSTEPARGAKNTDGTPRQPLYADATSATYTAASQLLRLTGTAAAPPSVHNQTLQVTADAITYDRGTGAADASGAVRSTYLQAPAPHLQTASATQASVSRRAPGLGGQGAVHVVGAAAHLQRDTEAVTFTGNAASPARLWQGANSVDAPTLVLGKQEGTLEAHGPGAKGASGAQAVHAIFADRGSKGGATITRVGSQTLFYSDSTRMGDFRGDVVAEQPTGTVHADDAQFFLTEAPAGQPSQLERMVAAGGVVLTQPGRRATGERLVYTAANGDYVLTGTAAAAPRVTDAERGTTTGAELLLRGSDNTVQVLSRAADGERDRTVTDTRTAN